MSDAVDETPLVNYDVPVVEIDDLEVNFAGRVGLIAGLRGKKAADAKAVDGVTLTLHEGESSPSPGNQVAGRRRRPGR